MTGIFCFFHFRFSFFMSDFLPLIWSSDRHLLSLESLSSSLCFVLFAFCFVWIGMWFLRPLWVLLFCSLLFALLALHLAAFAATNGVNGAYL